MQQAEFASNSASAAMAREFVTAHLEEHHLPDLVEDVRLVVSELATNAIRHARTPFTVILRGDPTSLLLTVRDGSPLAPLMVIAQVMDTRGRGVAIVAALSQRWGSSTASDGAKSVWARFDRHRSPSGS
ncbi:ATP-binding protein [Nocardioides panacis]|uniref:ATP-binding protein n=1 Tax=Nocardioides panacis TaxID=2849501 RepID=A0A975SZB2_9ACTN|nr:ATP-binding protein [Nocardioides panacis]QWZ08729.1 ATP-binding protein [Nocardioides panacis]